MQILDILSIGILLILHNHFDKNNYWIDFLGVRSNFNYQYFQPIPVLGEGQGLNISYTSE